MLTLRAVLEMLLTQSSSGDVVDCQSCSGDVVDSEQFWRCC